MAHFDNDPQNQPEQTPLSKTQRKRVMEELQETGEALVALSADRLKRVDLPDDLREAWRAIVQQARLHTHHTIQREELSVREHMGMILRRLRDADGFVEFADMFDVTLGAPVLVVHFLAMLELTREHLLEMTQVEAFAPIYVRLTDGRVEQGTGQPAGNASGSGEPE